jgi:hypothetical protein
MRLKRVSADASSAGGWAPGAKGRAGSCFQTWTWESMSRGPAVNGAANERIVEVAMEAAMKRRRFHIDALSMEGLARYRR